MIYLTKGIKQSEYKGYRETNGDFYNLVELTRKPQQAFNKSAKQISRIQAKHRYIRYLWQYHGDET